MLNWKEPGKQTSTTIKQKMNRKPKKKKCWHWLVLILLRDKTSMGRLFCRSQLDRTEDKDQEMTWD